MANEGYDTCPLEGLDSRRLKRVLKLRTIFLSRLHEALSLTEKEEDHVIISPTANVTPETGHIVVPGSIEWVTE